MIQGNELGLAQAPGPSAAPRMMGRRRCPATARGAATARRAALPRPRVLAVRVSDREGEDLQAALGRLSGASEQLRRQLAAADPKERERLVHEREQLLMEITELTRTLLEAVSVTGGGAQESQSEMLQAANKARAISFSSKGAMLACSQARQRLPPAGAASKGEGTRGVQPKPKGKGARKRMPTPTVRSDRWMMAQTVVLSLILSQAGPAGMYGAGIIFSFGFIVHVVLPLLTRYGARVDT